MYVTSQVNFPSHVNHFHQFVCRDMWIISLVIAITVFYHVNHHEQHCSVMWINFFIFLNPTFCYLICLCYYRNHLYCSLKLPVNNSDYLSHLSRSVNHLSWQVKQNHLLKTMHCITYKLTLHPRGHLALHALFRWTANVPT